MAQKKRKILETKFFGFIIAFFIFLISIAFQSLAPLKILDYAVLDTHFNLRDSVISKTYQINVTEKERNPNISPDILIAAIDTNSLSRFGKWPWPRYRHADFLNALSRIKNQNERERSVLLDIFFIEQSSEVENDALLVDAMVGNGRVFQETILDRLSTDPVADDETYRRNLVLFEKQPPIKNMRGDYSGMEYYYGSEPPLRPIGHAAAGFGHPTFIPDEDKTFRRQALVARSSHKLAVIKIDELQSDYPIKSDEFERLGWTDKEGREHNVLLPLTKDRINTLKAELEKNSPPVLEDSDGDGVTDKEYYIIYHYKDYFLPAITLSLALNYFNKTTNDLEVVVGSYIRIPSPQVFNTKLGLWEPYKLEIKPAKYSNDATLISDAEYKVIPEIRIPIDGQCSMLINFMGQQSGESRSSYQTFPIRSYAGYAGRITNADPNLWPPTLAVGNKIIMAGAFSQGVASDEKKTPFGLMYGIEMHANALNTILMNKFITALPSYQSLGLLFFVCMLVAFFSSRLSPPLTLILSLLLIIIFFFVSSLIFDAMSILIDFAVPSFAMILTMIAIIAYRVMTEEREKRAIHSMFGKYVSRDVVDQMIEFGGQPELGGVDKELTVFFSDIRGFTTLSESMTPQELVNHLNTYLTAMTDIIMEYKGTLDKYVGDEVMCFWGAPLPQQNHAFLACQCALRQMEKLRELNLQWPVEKRIDHGIGINSGIMTVGNMGSLGRMNYTLMGDNVNLGARLEGTNKEYGTHIIISEYTYGLVKERVVVRELDNIRVKGKNKPVMIYELVDVVG